MTLHTYICDRCGKEVTWVYSMPQLRLEGLKINLYDDPNNELCRDCAALVITEYRRIKNEKLTKKSNRKVTNGYK